MSGDEIMADEIFNVNIPSDSEGYVVFQCPYCGDRFKLLINEIDSDDVIMIFCPYCGLQGEPLQFISDEVKENVNIMLEIRMKELMNDFGKDLEKMFKNNDFISFKTDKKFKLEKEKLLFETDPNLTEMELQCCNKNVKVRALNKDIGTYCPYCGVK